jgi:hypothetical protein
MNESPVRPFAPEGDNYRWTGVEQLRYKEEGSAPFRDVTRQTLFRRPDLRGELRYFEVAPGGHSTLERHEHVHAVMVLRGSGTALVGDTVFPVGTFDLVRCRRRPGTNSGQAEAPLGFLHGRCRTRQARAPRRARARTAARQPGCRGFLDDSRE